MRLKRPQARHRGVAAVEFALVAPILCIILLGLWEVGRLIQLQQVLSNAAREGARVAAQSQTINSSGSPTQIHVDTGSPNVKQTIVNYLREAGVRKFDGTPLAFSDVTVTFAFLTGDTAKTQPYQGVKGQQFRVVVRIPVDPLAMSWLGFARGTLSASAVWTCLVDDPFTIDPNMPSW